MKNVLVIAICLASAPFSQADDGLASSRYSPWHLDRQLDRSSDSQENRWVFEIGAEVAYEPDYIGSDDYDVEAFPGVLVRWIPHEDWRFTLTPEALSGVYDITDNTLIQLVLEDEEGREASETEDLEILQDGEDTLEGELSIVHRFGSKRHTFAYARYQPDLQDNGKGVVWFLGLGHMQPLSDKIRVSYVIDLSWGDDEHMNTEFGLTTTQAGLLGVPSYDPSGALKSTTGGILIEWDLSENLFINAQAELEYYFSEASDSPLIDNLGSKTGYAFEMSVIYRF